MRKGFVFFVGGQSIQIRSRLASSERHIPSKTILAIVKWEAKRFVVCEAKGKEGNREKLHFQILELNVIQSRDSS